MTDLVLSVVKNRSWQDIDCYAISLAQSGFSGQKVMFVEDVPQDVYGNLRALGFEVIRFKTPDKPRVHFQTSRYLQAIEYLKNHRHDLRFVFWTDVCDLVFQKNPSEWMEQHWSYLVGAKEGRLIKSSGINDVWIQRLVSGEEYSWLREMEVLCSGTIQGEANNVYHAMVDMAKLFSYHNDMQGIDQGIWNLVARKHPHDRILTVPEMEDGFISTCGMFLSAGEENGRHVWTVKPPYFDRETGLVFTDESKKLPFTIMHCYNRSRGIFDPHGDWRQIVERRYRSL